MYAHKTFNGKGRIYVLKGLSFECADMWAHTLLGKMYFLFAKSN